MKLLWVALRFKWKAFCLGVSPRRIRNTYAIILEADLPDFIETEPGSNIWLLATGNEIHIQDRSRQVEFVMHDNTRGEVRVDQAMDGTVMREFDGVNVKTKWVEVYREGFHLESTEFYDVLEEIRGGVDGNGNDDGSRRVDYSGN